MESMGIKTNYALIDAYSEENISNLYAKNISFVTRVPAGRKLFTGLLKKTEQTLEKPINRIVHGDRVLYIVECG